jgi:glycosyltransferase involved in cell wall biosynthesis
MPADPVAGASMLESLSIPAGSPVIGYAGRLDAEKGVEELLRIFHRVCAQEPKARLLIAGGSPFQADAAARHLIDLAARLNLQDRVHFLGRLPDLTSFYAALTLFAHPAPREPFGLVVLEALAHGIPVVAFDTGGPREILCGFEPGLLVAAGNSDEFAATCCRVVRNEALLTRVRREGPGFVSTAFGPSVQGRAILEHYRSMLT